MCIRDSAQAVPLRLCSQLRGVLSGGRRRGGLVPGDVMQNAVAIPPIDWSMLGPLVWLLAGAVAVTLLAVGPRPWRHYTGYAALLALAGPAVATLRLWIIPDIVVGGVR